MAKIPFSGVDRVKKGLRPSEWIYLKSLGLTYEQAIEFVNSGYDDVQIWIRKNNIKLERKKPVYSKPTVAIVEEQNEDHSFSNFWPLKKWWRFSTLLFIIFMAIAVNISIIEIELNAAKGHISYVEWSTDAQDNQDICKGISIKKFEAYNPNGSFHPLVYPPNYSSYFSEDWQPQIFQEKELVACVSEQWGSTVCEYTGNTRLVHEYQLINLTIRDANTAKIMERRTFGQKALCALFIDRYDGSKVIHVDAEEIWVHVRDFVFTDSYQTLASKNEAEYNAVRDGYGRFYPILLTVLFVLMVCSMVGITVVYIIYSPFYNDEKARKNEKFRESVLGSMIFTVVCLIIMGYGLSVMFLPP